MNADEKLAAAAALGKVLHAIAQLDPESLRFMARDCEFPFRVEAAQVIGLQQLLDARNFQPLDAPHLERSGEEQLFRAFDDALNRSPFLQFEIGYTRVTDWMVWIHDVSGGVRKKLICEQLVDRSETCAAAAAALRDLFPEEPPV